VVREFGRCQSVPLEMKLRMERKNKACPLRFQFSISKGHFRGSEYSAVGPERSRDRLTAGTRMPTIIVLFGGSGSERLVSVASAQNIGRTLGAPHRFWYGSSAGAIHDVSLEELLAHTQPFEREFDPIRPAISPSLEQALDIISGTDPVVLLALHGGEGEDGRVQEMLEHRKIPFTGSGSAASAAAFDKAAAKEIVSAAGLHAPESELVPPLDPSQISKRIERFLADRPKAVLKPVADGSSHGLFFVDRGQDHADVSRLVSEAHTDYLLEQFLDGRELTVGVVDEARAIHPLPVLEIETDPGIRFDYAGKYHGKGVREVCPALISDTLASAAQRAALVAHERLGCRGYSRTDLVAVGDTVWYWRRIPCRA
jgi:D-alanine-D-alanine ligase